MTNEAPYYTATGRAFGGHGTVNHSIEEYVRGGFWHTNAVESYFAILSRGIFGVHQHLSPKHLTRYVGEFDFRYNARHISDAVRANAALRGIEGKRLFHRGAG